MDGRLRLSGHPIIIVIVTSGRLGYSAEDETGE